MELRSHALILKNARWFIVLMTILVGIAAALFAIFRPVSYQAVSSFELFFVNRPASAQQYQYGGYYEQKAGETYTQNLMSLMQNPAVVEEVYKTAQVPYTIESVTSFTGRFRAKQLSSQMFSVTFSDYSEDSARHLAQALSDVIIAHSEGTGSINNERIFYVNALEPVVVQHNMNIPLVTGLGILAGLIASIILVYLREYFRV